MKNLMVLILVVVAGAASGCKPDAKTEARLKAIEQRQQNLRDDLIAMSTNLDRILELTREMSASNQENNARIMSNVLESTALALEQREAAQAMLYSLTNKAAIAARAVPMAAYQQQRAQATALTRGVPTAIYNKIAAEAAREWPGDFRMQEYTIKTQIEAYQKLQGR